MRSSVTSGSSAVSAESVLDWLEAFVDELPVAPVQATLFKLQIEQGCRPGVPRRRAPGRPAPGRENVRRRPGRGARRVDRSRGALLRGPDGRPRAPGGAGDARTGG